MVAITEVVPGRTYIGRGSKQRSRRVIAIGPEHRPLPEGQPCSDGKGVLFVDHNGRQGNMALSQFARWASQPIHERAEHVLRSSAAMPPTMEQQL